MENFIKIKCIGSLNSFRLPDFHTYHKTLPLPPKPTIAGMLGSAAGLSPEEVNERLLLESNFFRVGILGKSRGKANDLWQIRKFDNKTITSYKKGEVSTPYKTAVIVRELLYDSHFTLYLSFKNASDFDFYFEQLKNPSWALSLGREDELVKVIAISIVSCVKVANQPLNNTVFIGSKYGLDSSFIKESNGINLLSKAPTISKLPQKFSYKGGVREAVSFESYVFVDDIPVTATNQEPCYFDSEDGTYFQLI
jgi:CRISPR-associated protein Cas5t